MAVSVVAADSDRAGSGPAFVGRETELAALQDCVRDALAGRARVVWVEAGAGSGKTALLRQALAGLPAGFRVVRAEADELATDAPLAVVAQLAPVSPVVAPFAAGLALLTAARRLGEDRVVLLVTSRPGGLVEDGWERFSFDADRCRRVTLGPLAGGRRRGAGRSGGGVVEPPRR